MVPQFQVLLFLITLVSAWLQTSIGYASALDLFGYSSRSVALAGATATTARGHAAAYYNPAALNLATTPSFSVGYQHAGFNLELNENTHEAENSPALILGFGIPIPFGGVLKDRISLGFGFVLPQGAILLARSPRPSQPSFPILETRAQTLSAQLALGIRVFDKLSIGVGTLALATLEGSIDAGPGITGEVSAQVQDSLIAHFAPLVGILVGPYADLTIAATWRGESLAQYSIPVRAELGTSIDIPIPPLDIAGIAQYDPQRATFEIAYQGLNLISLSTALTYRRWSNYQNPIEYPAAPEDYPAQPEPGFHDTWVPRVGIEIHLEWQDWLIEPRLGYCYEPSPAPEQTGFHNYLSSNRHIVGSGLGLRYSDFTVDIATQFHSLEHRKHQKDATMENESPVNPGYPTISNGGHILVWSAELGITF